MTLRTRKCRLDPIMVLLSMLTFLVVALVATLVYAMYFHDSHPAEFKSTTVITETVEAGGTLEFYLDWCENSLAPREVHRTWRNSLVYTQPTTNPNPAPIGCQVSHIQWDVPAGLALGEYTIGVTIVFDINHFTKRVEKFEVGPVTVVEAKIDS